MHLNYGANLPRVCTRGGTTVINATERYEFEIPDPVQVPKRKQQVTEILEEAEKYIWRIKEEMRCA